MHINLLRWSRGGTLSCVSGDTSISEPSDTDFQTIGKENGGSDELAKAEKAPERSESPIGVGESAQPMNYRLQLEVRLPCRGDRIHFR